MLLYGHDLDGVISVGRNTRQYLVAEFHICAYSLLLLRHADMAFIDEKRTGVGAEALHLPLIGLRSPDLR